MQVALCKLRDGFDPETAPVIHELIVLMKNTSGDGQSP